MFLFLILFSCNDKKLEVENLLSNNYNETIVFYKHESLKNYLFAKQKSEDYPYLEKSFDSIICISKILDKFYETYPNLNEHDKLEAILKTRKKIRTLTKMKLKFIDEKLLIKINSEILDKGIYADFSKTYYNITSNYCLKHCNIVE